MFNEQGVSAATRVASVWKTLPASILIRMLRFLVAYGIGGISNKYFVASLRNKVNARDVKMHRAQAVYIDSESE
jgi:hypothetical protein